MSIARLRPSAPVQTSVFPVKEITLSLCFMINEQTQPTPWHRLSGLPVGPAGCFFRLLLVSIATSAALVTRKTTPERSHSHQLLKEVPLLYRTCAPCKRPAMQQKMSMVLQQQCV